MVKGHGSSVRLRVLIAAMVCVQTSRAPLSGGFVRREMVLILLQVAGSDPSRGPTWLCDCLHHVPVADGRKWTGQSLLAVDDLAGSNIGVHTLQGDTN